MQTCTVIVSSSTVAMSTVLQDIPNAFAHHVTPVFPAFTSATATCASLHVQASDLFAVTWHAGGF